MVSAKQAAEIIKSQDNIHILMHASPDGDTIGSAHALYYALCALGKSCSLVCADELPEKYAYITDNAAGNCEHPDFVIASDVADEKLLGGVFEQYAGKIDLCIDHHKSNLEYAKSTCLDADASSACELMFSVIKHIGAQITPLIADCLYTGIATDTGCFKYSCTTARTHMCAAELIGLGADYAGINREMFDVKSKARIEVERAVLNDMRFFADEKIAVITLPLALIEQTGATPGELEGIAAIPRMVKGVEIGIMLKEKSENVYKISVRTTRYADASALCAVFGGGGHARAAGCTVNGEKREVIDKIIKEAKRLI